MIWCTALTCRRMSAISISSHLVSFASNSVATRRCVYKLLVCYVLDVSLQQSLSFVLAQVTTKMLSACFDPTEGMKFKAMSLTTGKVFAFTFNEFAYKVVSILTKQV